MKQKSALQILDEWEVVIAPILFTAVAVFTRLWKIGLSNIVTWDEAQYVKLSKTKSTILD
jgi:dolichyl-phosphate-mannose-protein mannosyltransferase